MSSTVSSTGGRRDVKERDSRATRALVVAIAMLFACGDDDAPTTDAGTDAGASCTSDSACDDGVFCNGAERCAEGTCLPGAPPCGELGSCFEAEETCATCPDTDEDGFADNRCGGSDCDDRDPAVSPGAREVCDEEHVDEDCDPATVAGDEGDLDEDGVPAAICCNRQPSGNLACGRDCDDADPAARPGSIEVCDRADNDCDGRVDENPVERFCRDLDGDGFGNADETIVACFAPPGFVVDCSDCDDTRGFVRPDAEEVCDTGVGGAPPLDESCNGERNEGCACALSDPPQACGPAEVGRCERGVQTCEMVVGGSTRWGSCVGAVEARAELCDALDDDCDGSVDEDFECAVGTNATGTNACGRSGMRSCTDACRWDRADFGITAESASTCDYCDDTGRGIADELVVASRTRELVLGSSPSTIERFGGWALEGPWASLTSEVGGIFLAEAAELGHRLVATVRVNVPTRRDGARPTVGWALVVVDGATLAASEVSGTGELLGVPRGRDGVAIEWRFARSAADDRLVVRGLDADGLDPVRHEGTYATGMRDQELRVSVELDLPQTRQNETRLHVEARGAVTAGTIESTPFETLARCGGPGETSCEVRLTAGRAHRLGVTASTTNASTVALLVAPSEAGSFPAARFELTGLCPE